MPRVSKEDLLKKANSIIGDNPSDEALSLLEDISDTLEDNNDISEYTKKITELENKVATIDKEWRDKYRARFLDYTPDTDAGAQKSEEDNGANDDDIEPPSFEDLAAEF